VALLAIASSKSCESDLQSGRDEILDGTVPVLARTFSRSGFITICLRRRLGLPPLILFGHDAEDDRKREPIPFIAMAAC